MTAVKLICEDTLDMYRTAGRCEVCGVQCEKREPMHVLPRGMAGSTRLDIHANLVAGGSSKKRCCWCHWNHHHDKEPTQEDLVVIVARREMVRPVDVRQVWEFFLKLDKHASPDMVIEALKPLLPLAKSLALKCMPVEVCDPGQYRTDLIGVAKKPKPPLPEWRIRAREMAKANRKADYQRAKEFRKAYKK